MLFARRYVVVVAVFMLVLSGIVTGQIFTRESSDAGYIALQND